MSARSRATAAALALTWRAALVLVAAGACFIAWTAAPDRSATTRHAPAPANPATPGDSSAGPVAATVAAYPTIAAHPLFYPSRSPWTPPPPPPPPAVSTAPPPLTNYALVGVIVSGQKRSALIRPPGTAKIITLAEGQELDGWKLQEITRAQLRFAAGDSIYEMTFPRPSEKRR